MTIWHVVSLAGLTLSAWAGFQSAHQYLNNPKPEVASTLQNSYLQRLALTLAAFSLAVLLGLTAFGIVQDGVTKGIGYLAMMSFWTLAWYAWAMAGIALSSLLLKTVQISVSGNGLKITAAILPPTALLAVFVPMLAQGG